MDELTIKKENYKKIFGEFEIEKEEKDKYEKFISAYSYYISKTNKNYKYNLTYLHSYFEEFVALKHKIAEKEKVVESIEMALLKKSVNISTAIDVTLDQFWHIWINKEGVQRGYTDILDKSKIMSKFCWIEIDGKDSKEKINIAKEIDKNNIENEIDGLLDKMEKLLKVRKDNEHI